MRRFFLVLLAVLSAASLSAQGKIRELLMAKAPEGCVEQSWDVDGVKRTALVRVPSGVTGPLAVVFMMNVDFSFLKVAIVIGSICALGVIVVSLIAGWSLGTWFSIAMILLMATVILYQTNEIKNTMETDQHVAAAFVLFSSFVTLLFYVIRFFAGDRRE